MPQLDSLRALAFFGVAASHWLTLKVPGATIGGTGVQLFFVLSGFLITGILLDYRSTQERTRAFSLVSALRTFYARRFLRIFPLFYGVIVVMLILNFGPIRKLWPWHVFYASNFLYAFHEPRSDLFRHFWSLAVEEQFYLAWPFLVMFLPLPTVKRLILALVILAPVFRIGMEAAFPEINRVNYLPLSCGDSLGAGAWLALASRFGGQLTRPVAELARNFGVIGLAGGLITAALIFVFGKSFFLEQVGHTFLVCVFAWMVFRASRGFSGLPGWILNRPELQFLGRISYGLYVYHNFFSYLRASRVFAALGLPLEWTKPFAVQIAVRFVLTLLLATASWYLYELPWNNLKRHFTLRKKLSPSPDPTSPDSTPLTPEEPRAQLS